MRPLMTAALVSALGCALAGTATGQTAAPLPAVKDIGALKQAAGPLPRYRFSVADGMVVRLDGETGKVVMCKPAQGGKWACSDVPEDSAPMQAQVKVIETDSAKDNSKISEQLSELQKQLGMPDEERAAIRKEIAALRDDIAALRQQIASSAPGDAVKSEVARLTKDKDNLAVELGRLRTEMTARSGENAALRDKVAALQDEMGRRTATAEPPPPVPPAPVPAPKSQELKMPSKEELAQARAAIADAWRRVVEMMKDLRRDLTGKEEGPVRL
jgi:regulator of replication initiation timing